MSADLANVVFFAASSLAWTTSRHLSSSNSPHLPRSLLGFLWVAWDVLKYDLLLAGA